MPRPRPLLAFATTLLLAPIASADETLRIDVARDTWVSNYGDESLANLGGANRLKTKGIQEFSLLDIDEASAKQLRGRVIKSVTLHVKPVSPEHQLRDTVSTIATPWVEGASPTYRPQPGGASYLSPVGDVKKPWAWPGSDLTAVMAGEGGTIWSFADASPPDASGFQSIRVDPRVMAARAAGVSHGFVLFDDTGSEYKREGDKFTHLLFPNRFVASREAGRGNAPHFSVTLGEPDTEPPPAVTFDTNAPGPYGTPAGPGEIVVHWRTPADQGPAGTLGFLAAISSKRDTPFDQATPLPRYLIPMAGKPGEEVTLRLRDVALPAGDVFLHLRAVDAAGNIGPAGVIGPLPKPSASEITLEAAPAPPTAHRDAALPRLGAAEVFVVDALDKVLPVAGDFLPARPEGYARTNHLWSAADKLITLHAARGESVAFQLVFAGQVNDAKPRLEFLGDTKPGASPAVKLQRLRYVQSNKGPLPDPLVPLESSFTTPSADDQIPGQKFASFIVDIHVPKRTPPGLQFGKLLIDAGGQSVEFDVKLEVWDFALPDRLSFIPQMNTYGLPGPPLETAYYRLAHEYRTCLNRLAYNWGGRVNDGCAPARTSRGFDWTAWDKRFGPLLNGSAFADLPRAGAPLDAFYLPINENWPMSIEQGFRGGYWAEQALTQGYRAELVAAVAAFAEHMTERKYDSTHFEFFLNGKVFFKKSGWNSASSPWIFDEPVNTQDFWALRWYGMAFKEGVAAAKKSDLFPAAMGYRCDVSRPQWQRDMLDGVLDYNVVGGDLRRHQRLVRDRQLRAGGIFYNYGSSNLVEHSNTQPAAWCVDAWCLGADGVVPWQTVGNNNSWARADQLSIFYPPGGGGSASARSPSPSVRLLAYREGQQMVEYLTILAGATGKPRWMVADAVRRDAGLDATVVKTSESDAGTVNYDKVDPVSLWQLRMRVGRMLHKLAPKDREQWVSFHPGSRGIEDVREIAPLK